MATAIWLVLVLIAIFLVYIHRKFYAYDSRFLELAMKFPGPRRLPFIGSAYTFSFASKKLLNTLLRHSKTYQPNFGIWMGPVFYVVVYKPKDVEVVLSSNTCKEKGSVMYNILASALGDGIATSGGDKWRKHRRMINPIFSIENLKDLIHIFYSKVTETCDLLEKEVNNPNFNIYSYNKWYGMSVLIATLVSTEFEMEFAHEKSALLEHVVKINESMDYRITKPWLYPDFIYEHLPCGKELLSSIKFVHNFLFKVADTLKKNMHLNGNKKFEDKISSKKLGSILKYLLQIQANPANNLTDKDLYAELRTIIGAAFETSTSSIGFLLFILSRHPEVQEKVVDEILQRFGSLEEKPFSYQDLCKLYYLDRVVKEGLRLYPTGPYVLRRVSEDTKLPSGNTLPRGSNVIVFIYSLHRDPDSFPNPEKFDPDNFLPENVAARSKYAYAPFSHGPRNCIGQNYALLNIKTQLVVILRRFRLTPTDIEPELCSVFTLSSKNGIHVGLQRRTHKK